MGARDNIHSNRSREEIDFDQEAQRKVRELRFQMLGAFKDETYRSVIEELARVALDPKTTRRTRVVALQAYARAAGNLVAEKPIFNIDNRTGVFTMQDFLQAAAGPSSEGLPDTTGCGPALPSVPTTIPLPNAGASGAVGVPSSDLRLVPPEVRCPEAGVTGASKPEDGPPSRVRSEPASVPPSAPLAQEKGNDEPEKGTRAWAEWHAAQPPPPPPPQPRCEDCGMKLDHEPHDCPVPPTSTGYD